MEEEEKPHCYCCGYEKVVVLEIENLGKVVSCPRCQHLSRPGTPTCDFSHLRDPPLHLTPLPQTIVLVDEYVVGVNVYRVGEETLAVVFCQEKVFKELLTTIVQVLRIPTGTYVINGSEIYRELVYGLPPDLAKKHEDHVEKLRIRYTILTGEAVAAELYCTQCDRVLTAVLIYVEEYRFTKTSGT